MDTPIVIRRLQRHELQLVREIDRREVIELLYEQRGAKLVAHHGDFSSHGWDPHGDGDHSVASQVRALEYYADKGGIGLGAFADEHLVAIAMVVPHLRPGVAQLAYLHVTAPVRATGIGTRLCDQLDEIAREAGDAEMVVMATPSENTVRFYRGRGFEPMAAPFPELLALEPDDVHMHRTL